MKDIILAIVCTPIMFVAFLLWMACVQVVISAVMTYTNGECKWLGRMLRRFGK